MKKTALILSCILFMSACSKKENFQNFTYPNGKYKAVIMSYDDGTIEDIELIKLFDKNGIVGTFNLNSGYLGTKKEWPQYNGDTLKFHYISEDSISIIYKNHEVAAHGAFHKDFLKISSEEILQDLEPDIKKLKQLSNKEITSMAYPFGSTSDSIAKLISTTSITNARTVNDTKEFELPTLPLMWNPTCHDHIALDHSERFLALNKTELSLFYVWGHSWEFRDKKRWDNMVKLCEQVGNQDDIWYVGCGEFISYLKALEKVEIGETKIVNPTDNPTVWVKFESGFKKLAPGDQLKITREKE